ncbi:cytosolic protein [Fictibacillus sp. Mic-4]|uniref:hypothetical protein n=1 Tax=Fictibacillus TaxID=1329200 RepID=UPI000421D677|nr:hypothetical protein [Fictibacillus gelatini]
MLKKMRTFLTNSAETRENHNDPEFQTHYFKARQADVMKAISGIIQKKPSCRLLGISEERGEIAFEMTKPRKSFVVITVITVKPFRVAVDLNVSTETSLPFDFGNSKKIISNFYRELKEELEFIGTSLAEK